MAFQRFFGAFHPPYTVELKYILIFVLFTMFVHQTKKKKYRNHMVSQKSKTIYIFPAYQYSSDANIELDFCANINFRKLCYSRICEIQKTDRWQKKLGTA